MTTGRPRDEFAWRHVNRLIDGKLECKFCGKVFAGTASRIRNHLSGNGKGIKECPSVPTEIKEEALNRRDTANMRGEMMSNPNNNYVLPRGDINLVGERDMMGNYVLPRGDLVDTNHSVLSLSEIFSGGGVPSADVNEYMSGLSQLITPSAVAQGVSGMEIDSVVVNMAHLGVPSSSAAAPLQVDMAPVLKNSSTSNSHVSITKKATDEHVTDAFMKLLMLDNCSSSAVTDFMKSPHLREFLERASEYGVPSALLAGDSDVVRKSMFNITDEVYRHTVMLRESWKTTGCTLMVFQGIFPSHDHKMCLFGFYCPKGIVFVEAPDLDLGLDDFMDALVRHNPSLEFDYATTYVILRHSHQGSADLASDVYNLESRRCLRDEIQEICIDVCRESAWAESLLNRAVEIHEQICCHMRQGYYQILQKDVESFNDLDNIKGLPAFRLSVFLSLMRRRDELSEYIEAILDDLNDNFCKLYREGWKLERVLTYTMKFSECMDTLVPTSGYLATAIQQLEGRLLRLGIGEPVVIEGEDSFTFWKELKSRLTGIIQGSSSMEAASYMNPHYFLHKDVQKDPQLPQKVNKALIKALNLPGDEYDSADEEDELLLKEVLR